jgi:DNA repair photolyase
MHFEMSIEDFTKREEWDGIYTIIECRKALGPSRLPGLNYALNPYTGCTHGCVYCYAPEVTHSEWRDWRAVKVKINIAERLAKELRGVSGVIGIGTVTDPYQEPERRFELTRRCLNVISGSDMGVTVMTKSDLVLRDMDLIGRMQHSVGVTVTTLDDSVSKRTEPGAPLPKERLDAMRTMVEAGMDVYLLAGPLMSTLRGHEREYADAVLDTGVRYVSIDRLNPRPLLSERLSKMHISAAPDTVELVKEYLRDGGMIVEDAF